MNIKGKSFLSNCAILIVILFCLSIDFKLKNWEKDERVIEHDIHSYYAYLPAIFIYHDIKIEKSDYKYKDSNWFWPVVNEEGQRSIKMTMGLSILYAPFFFIAHFFAIMSDYPGDGFSEPYKFFLLLSSVFYLAIGLDFLKKFLRGYNFKDSHIAITILLLGLGTNLLCYSSQSAPMSHVYNFCLFSAFVYYTIVWHKTNKMREAVLLGVLLGIISLIRPTNAVILIFFIFYGISNFQEARQKLGLIKNNFFQIVVVVFIVVIIWMPQIIYWKIVTGEYFFYSYTDEGFYFNKPRILEGLFSFRKGWLLYTPIAAIGLTGIFFLKQELKKIRFSILFFLAINTYIVFSWWCWWYGGSYGQRSLIESYAILSIPMASVVKFISERQIYLKGLFLLTTTFFVWLNIFQTFQFEYQSLHWDAMTKELYFKQFGKLESIKDFDQMLDYPNYEEAKKGNDSYAQYNEGGYQEVFSDKDEIDRKSINMKAFNKMYVCVDVGMDRKLIANREIPYLWETLTLIELKRNKCALLSFENKFLCDEINNNNQITATRKGRGSWETFDMIAIEENKVAFKAISGKYLSADKETLQIYARADSIGETEKFEIIKLNP